MQKTKAFVDATTKVLLDAVTKAAGELHIKWMVTGAAGRVMLLEGIYDLPHGRATQDLDLGVMVASWGEYQALVGRIREDKRFVLDPKQQQRLLYSENGLLDLVPFGDVETSDRVIYWPPNDDFRMSVMGFREAYGDAIDVPIDRL